MTGAGIHAENRLFDTLDTTSRKFKVSDTCEVVISDTVGFIRKLPHHLTRAFRATLEELLYADLLLHVVDASNPEAGEHARVVESVIEDLGAGEIPTLTVFNKCDVSENLSDFPKSDDAVCISAKTGEGTDELREKICKKLLLGQRQVNILIPYAKTALLDILHREGKVLSQEYGEAGVMVEAIVNDKIYGKIMSELGGEAFDEL